MKKCDMCGSQIVNNRCSCGTWSSKEENENNPLRLSLIHFHEMQRMCLTTDAPHLGCAAVYFRGDYNDCEKVQEFILKMKNRPFYNHE